MMFRENVHGAFFRSTTKQSDFGSFTADSIRRVANRKAAALDNLVGSPVCLEAQCKVIDFGADARRRRPRSRRSYPCTFIAVSGDNGRRRWCKEAG